ncbi:MAG: hypothetical protein JST85_21430 [Acidobacteria bacterium]|nr:hypothetical protein [Acidobacteriota bacterium]
MDDILKLELELASEEPKEIKKLVDRCLEVLDRDHAARAKVWEEIDQITRENDAALAHLRSLMQKAA